MNRYTADTNALPAYLVDVLPERGGDAFSRAEQGTAAIEAPEYNGTLGSVPHADGVSGISTIPSTSAASWIARMVRRSWSP